MKEDITEGYKHSFLLYNNLLDLNKNFLSDSIFEGVIAYPNVERLFGKAFLDKFREVGFKAFNLVRTGGIDSILEKFEKISGFSSISKKMRDLAKSMGNLDISSKAFKEKYNQLLRLFSELRIPWVLSNNTKIIEFQPKKIGRSCDNISLVGSQKVEMEITSINTNGLIRLEQKISDIFQEKGQEQLSRDVPGLLVLDITESGIECFVKESSRFYVKFPISKTITECIKNELEKKENNHIIGVLITASMIVINNDDFPAITWDLHFIKNENSHNNYLVDKILNNIN